MVTSPGSYALEGRAFSRLWQQLEDRNLTVILAWLGFLIIWEIVGRSLNPVFLSYPSAVVVAFYKLAVAGELHTALASSLQAFAVGFVLAAVVGVTVGVLMGRFRLVEYGIDLFVNALYSSPSVAFIPLIILWFGLGLQAKIVIVFLSAVFPVLINTYVGARDISHALVEVGDAFVANKRQQLTKIVLWGTFPYIVGGLRLGLGRAIGAMVVAEFLTAISGLGALILIFANNFRTDQLWVPVVMLLIMGVGLTKLLMYFEKKLAYWKETERAQQ